MLDYRLKVFRVVAEKLNFTRAAEALHISQPAVTQHVKALEATYGTPLFRRGAGGITLTPAGQVLFAAAGQAAELERRTEAQLRKGQPKLAGPLRLGSSTTIAQYFLPAHIGRFQRDYPAVELTLRIGNTREVADAVRAGQLDLGLVEGPGERHNLSASPFFDDELVCVASPRHPLAHAARPLTPAELSRQTFVMREPGSGTRDVVERALRRARVRPERLRVMIESDSSETIKGLVRASEAVAFLSRLVIANELAAHQLVILPIRGLVLTRKFFTLHPQGPRPGGPPGEFMAQLAGKGRVDGRRATTERRILIARQKIAGGVTSFTFEI